MKDKIFIHADDYGYSKNISQDILSCIDDGIVNSVSVMIHANIEDFENIKKRELKNISLHINLTSLNLSEQYVNYKILNNLSFSKLFFANKKLQKICKSEIHNQISMFKEIFGNEVISIDGHHHIQVIPWIFKFLRNEEFHIQLRIPNEKVIIYSLKLLKNITFWRNLIAVKILKILSLGKNKYRAKNFAGLLYSGIYNEKILLKHIKKLSKSGLPFEITFHPGSGTKLEKGNFKPNHFKYVTSKNRKSELSLLKNFSQDNIF